jgi:voltage-gated potassium channel Kch
MEAFLPKLLIFLGLRRFGFEVYYGDVTRLDLLESARAAEAELLIITLGDHEKSMELVKLAQTILSTPGPAVSGISITLPKQQSR